MLLIEVKCIFSRICHKICLQLRLRQRGPISLFGSIFYLNFNFKIIINMLNFIFRSKYLTIMLPRISAFICVQNKLKYFHSPNWILAHFAAILAHCAAVSGTCQVTQVAVSSRDKGVFVWSSSCSSAVKWSVDSPVVVMSALWSGRNWGWCRSAACVHAIVSLLSWL